ncbi:hypothetical protein D9613_002507 [Agrocybe pediades]|uniref:F-box domain-containing protein n=1 Tax=Agrocybe pediades TaxID=84607 RepID=A0A8H4QR48_9AGAR|nr:hypothetical protein D9613_002507 [Agrocybe pediades]
MPSQPSSNSIIGQFSTQSIFGHPSSPTTIFGQPITPISAHPSTPIFGQPPTSIFGQPPADRFKRWQLPELWEIIAKYCTPADLEALALTCSFLCYAVRRVLFKELIFEVDHGEDYEDLDVQGVKRLYQDRAARAVERLRGLASRDVIAESVRKWHCDGSHIPEEYEGASKEYYRATIPIFFQTLDNYRLLKTLTLVGLQLDEKELATIEGLQSLERLAFDGCNFKTSFIATDHGPLRLKGLVVADEEDFNSPHEHEPFMFCEPERLEHVVLNCRHSENLPVMMLEMLMSGKCASLVVLEITVHEETTSLLMELLEQCPRLEDLTINEDPNAFEREWFIDCEDLTEEACPGLSEFAGPAVAAIRIIKGRPIQRLYIRGCGVHDYYCPIEDICQAVGYLDAERVTELFFEYTKTGEARQLLHLIDKLQFPNLRTLALPIDDQQDGVQLTLEETLQMSLNVLGMDDEWHKDQDIMHIMEQYMSCYDDYAGGKLADYKLQDARGERNARYADGYLRLLADIASGALSIPKNIVRFHMTQSRIFKRLEFTIYHEFALLAAFADIATSRMKNLSSVSIGIENIHHKPWERNSEDQWTKPGVFLRSEEGPEVVLTGKLVMFPPRPNAGSRGYRFVLVPDAHHPGDDSKRAFIYLNEISPE